MQPSNSSSTPFVSRALRKQKGLFSSSSPLVVPFVVSSQSFSISHTIPDSLLDLLCLHLCSFDSFPISEVGFFCSSPNHQSEEEEEEEKNFLVLAHFRCNALSEKNRVRDTALTNQLTNKEVETMSETSGPPSDVDQMKERYSKLLLGEDMSGCGKGVSSALALSNAITNLAASAFSELNRLEPMTAEKKARWRKEIDWLLSVTDYIVEFVPSQQVSKDGTNMEIMVTKLRKDLLMNIPALRKLDAMLLSYLDNFKDQNEFWYVKKDADDSEQRNDKWWLPAVKVPPDGLSDVSRKWLQFQKESVNQVLKAAMAINAQVLMEMEIPDAYIEALPKNGRASLGDAIYKSITTDDIFNPEKFLSAMDLSTEHKVLELKNKIEASVVIWNRKMQNKDGKSSWGSSVSLEKREQFEDRAETILHLIKHRYPGIPQSGLDVSKIQYNRDVGQAVLESYSRVLETLAYSLMSKIEDVLYADTVARDPTRGSSGRRNAMVESEKTIKKLDPKEELEKLNNMEGLNSMTLSDFMGWHTEQDADGEKKETGSLEDLHNSDDGNLKKPPKVVTNNKKFSFIEKLENLGGLRSPTARH